MDLEFLREMLCPAREVKYVRMVQFQGLEVIQNKCSTEQVSAHTRERGETIEVSERSKDEWRCEAKPSFTPTVRCKFGLRHYL